MHLHLVKNNLADLLISIIYSINHNLEFIILHCRSALYMCISCHCVDHGTTAIPFIFHICILEHFKFMHPKQVTLMDVEIPNLGQIVKSILPYFLMLKLFLFLSMHHINGKKTQRIFTICYIRYIRKTGHSLTHTHAYIHMNGHTYTHASRKWASEKGSSQNFTGATTHHSPKPMWLVKTQNNN